MGWTARVKTPSPRPDIVPDWFRTAKQAGETDAQLMARTAAFCALAQQRRADKQGDAQPTTPPDPSWVQLMFMLYNDTDYAGAE